MSQAGIWTLDSAATPESIATSHVEYSSEHGGISSHESIIGMDRRVRALEGDFMDGGRYRSVVKILARFGDLSRGTSVWMMGTGWLVQPDVLVTAGHVVYDWSKRLGEAKEIRCYIGYNGRSSIGQQYVQSRSGKKIVITAEWLEDTGDRARTKDVAFIQVDRPFTGNLQLFSYVNTPVSSQSTNLGIVGYPGDKYLKDEEGEDEGGAQMYEEFQYTDYDIGKSSRKMIEYKVSTFGGQSGAPIIRRGNNMVAIGTHCYGGGGYEANSGNSIGGQYGNVYQNYISLLGRDLRVMDGRATSLRFLPYTVMAIGRHQASVPFEADESNDRLYTRDSAPDEASLAHWTSVVQSCSPTHATFRAETECPYSWGKPIDFEAKVSLKIIHRYKVGLDRDAQVVLCDVLEQGSLPVSLPTRVVAKIYDPICYAFTKSIVPKPRDAPLLARYGYAREVAAYTRLEQNSNRTLRPGFHAKYYGSWYLQIVDPVSGRSRHVCMILLEHIEGKTLRQMCLPEPNRGHLVPADAKGCPLDSTDEASLQKRLNVVEAVLDGLVRMRHNGVQFRASEQIFPNNIIIENSWELYSKDVLPRIVLVGYLYCTTGIMTMHFSDIEENLAKPINPVDSVELAIVCELSGWFPTEWWLDDKLYLAWKIKTFGEEGNADFVLLDEENSSKCIRLEDERKTKLRRVRDQQRSIMEAGSPSKRTIEDTEREPESPTKRNRMSGLTGTVMSAGSPSVSPVMAHFSMGGVALDNERVMAIGGMKVSSSWYTMLYEM